MKRLIAPLLLALPSAFANASPATAWKPFKFTLEPGKVHEECLRVDEGARRRYHWKADGPVDFNIHFHRGSDVTYPVKREAMRGDGGTFTAQSAEDYCWMWTARNAPVTVEGGIEQR